MMNARRILSRLKGRLTMAVGRASSSRPLCPDFGFSRGTPVDRYYIERFLEEHSADIRGRVLEIGDDAYSRRFGGSRIEHQDVLHLRQGQPGATITGDLANPTVLPAGSFDCIILTQTLHLIFDTASAIRNIHHALRPGGAALVTVPGITLVDRGEWRNSWYWSFTEYSLRRLLKSSFETTALRLVTYGNLYAATAFLHGAAVEELQKRKLDELDETYPVIVASRVVA